HPATTRHNDDVGLAGHEGSVWNETQSVGARHKRLRSTCYQTHTEGRARLASATHDLHRAERVHFVETVVDHNVNQHGARACPELRGIWVSIHADSMRRYRQARCRGGRVA